MKQLRIFKYVIYIIISLIVASAIAAFAFVYFFPKNTLKNIIKNTIQNAIHRPVYIKDIDYSLAHIKVYKLYIYNDESKKDFLAFSEEAYIGFRILPLINKQFIINNIILDNANIKIIFDDKGKSNIDDIISPKTSEKSAISTKINTITLKNTNISLINPVDSLKPLEGTYTVNSIIYINKTHTVDIQNLAIKLPLQRGKIKGDIYINIKPAFNIQGKLTLNDCNLLWVYKWGNNLHNVLPYRVFNGSVNDLFISKHKVSGFIKGSCSLINKNYLYLNNGFCNVDLKNKRIIINNLKSKIESSEFFIDSLIFDFKGNIQNLSVKNASIFFQDITPLFGKINLSFINARLAGNFVYNDNTINADLKINDLILKDKKIFYAKNLNIIIKNNQIDKKNIKAQVFNNLCDLSIKSFDNNFSKFIINAHFDTLNLTSFNVFNKNSQNKNNATDTKKESKPLNLLITGKLLINKLISKNFTIKNVNTSYIYRNNEISIPSFSAEIFNGVIMGQTKISLNKKIISSKAKFQNIKIQNITDALNKYKGRIFGIISGRMDFITTLNPSLKTTTGQIEISVDNGKLANTGLQNSLSAWLDDLKYKLKNLEFKKIYGNLSINKSYINIKSFIFNAPDIKIKLNGNYFVDSGSNMNIVLEFNSNFIQDLPNPVLIQLNQYKYGRWYILKFKGQGKDIFSLNKLEQVK